MKKQNNENGQNKEDPKVGQALVGQPDIDIALHSLLANSPIIAHYKQSISLSLSVDQSIFCKRFIDFLRISIDLRIRQPRSRKDLLKIESKTSCLDRWLLLAMHFESIFSKHYPDSMEEAMILP